LNIYYCVPRNIATLLERLLFDHERIGCAFNQEMDRNLECCVERMKKTNKAVEMVHFAEMER
jgi:hypothetical protein